MKSILTIVATLICACLADLAAAEKVQAGAKGGRILERTTPKAEFYVEKDRTVSIHFYDATGKPVPAAEQSLTVIAEPAGGKEKLEFTKKDNALVSTSKLPSGDGYNVVVQFKQAPGARPQNYRFMLDTSTCGGCKLAEYACTCHD